MTDEGPIKYFILGINVKRIENNIYLSQETYLREILKKYNMENCNATLTPLETKIDVENLKISDNNPEDTKYPCRNAIGSLMYAMLCSRPDLCYAISLLSRFQAKPSRNLWNLIKQVLQYVRRTVEPVYWNVRPVLFKTHIDLRRQQWMYRNIKKSQQS